jgi:hypothetical protein
MQITKDDHVNINIIPLSSARETGMIVIASIHEPTYDLLRLFDNLLFLADGRTAYSDKTGSPAMASCILFGLLYEISQKAYRTIWHHLVTPFRVSFHLAYGLFSRSHGFLTRIHKPHVSPTSIIVTAHPSKELHRDFMMDLMNSDFSREDLTDWLTVAWKCGQSTNSASSSSFWADGPVPEVHVPEALKEKTQAQNSFPGFMRSVGILTTRNVCVSCLIH